MGKFKQPGTGMGREGLRRSTRYDSSGNPRAPVRHDPHGVADPAPDRGQRGSLGTRGATRVDDVAIGGGAISRSVAGGRVRRVDPI